MKEEKEINEIVKLWILFVIEQQKFAIVRCLGVCVRALVKISLFFFQGLTPAAERLLSLSMDTHTRPLYIRALVIRASLSLAHSPTTSAYVKGTSQLLALFKLTQLHWLCVSHQVRGSTWPQPATQAEALTHTHTYTRTQLQHSER
jgi:hypothetical protein